MILTFKFKPHTSGTSIESFKNDLSKLEVKFQDSSGELVLKTLALPIVNSKVVQHTLAKYDFIEAVFIERFAGDSEPILKVF